jgi:hypothetical protein
MVQKEILLKIHAVCRRTAHRMNTTCTLVPDQLVTDYLLRTVGTTKSGLLGSAIYYQEVAKHYREFSQHYKKYPAKAWPVTNK